MATVVGDLGIASGSDGRPEPLVWRHPHARGACVVEDVDGSLWLLFEREGSNGWQRRRRWTNGVSLLLPYGSGADELLARLGYSGSAAEPERRSPTMEL